MPKPAASVNVGFTAVAVSVGASFTGTTVTVEAIDQSRGVHAAVGRAAAVLDLRQREDAVARRRIVGVGVSDT